MPITSRQRASSVFKAAALTVIVALGLCGCDEQSRNGAKIPVASGSSGIPNDAGAGVADGNTPPGDTASQPNDGGTANDREAEDTPQPANPSTGPAPAEREDPVEPDNGGTPAEGGDDVPPREASVRPPNPDADILAHPFPSRISAEHVPEFPEKMEWLNTAGPLRLKDLKGRFVLLDFWTYCCINCMHILPELKKLEQAYPNQLVVIGVHSAKFDGEKSSKNIAEAILRYQIEHPVVNDGEHAIWNSFAVDSWPTMVLIDPAGDFLGRNGGEFKFEDIDPILRKAIPYYRQEKLLDESPIRFERLAYSQPKTPLRFPGKVLADEKGNRLFIADSNHNRIVIARLDGTLIETIGSGANGAADGDYAKASFNQPQGMALLGNTLYVADTENHLLRKIDLAAKRVATIAGTGKQGRNAWPGLDLISPRARPPKRYVGKPLETGLNSPWALWVHRNALYIAMAGPHQIWKMRLDEKEIGPFAGNGREDIVDGRLLPPLPYQEGYSSFAQPSGLASDGTWLFVADSEGSSIRAVPFNSSKRVRTVVGSSQLPGGRLFHFGDRDGKGLLRMAARDPTNLFPPRGIEATEGVALQHALGVVYHDRKIYVADTYNNKIKVVDPRDASGRTIAGTGEAGSKDQPPQFDEPAGIHYASGKLFVADTNNHLIRTIDLKDGNKVATLEIKGLEPPKLPKREVKPSFPGATQVKLAAASVKADEGQIQLAGHLKLPEGWKINPLAPMRCLVEAVGPAGPVSREALGKFVKISKPAAEFTVKLPVTGTGEDTLLVSMNYYYCQTGNEGLCKVGSVVWTVPIRITADATAASVALPHEISASPAPAGPLELP